MKKINFCVLLVLMLVLSLMAVSVSAEETETPHSDHCVCGGTLTEEAVRISGHSCDTVPWEAWGDEEGETGLPKTTGNWYLVGDVEITSQKNTGDCDVKSGQTVNLCLNGHSVTATARVFDVYGTLSICDCQGEGAVIGNTARKTTSSGSVFIVRNGGVMCQYGGQLKQADGIEPLTSAGGASYVMAGGQYALYGGQLLGGSNTGSGGNIYSEGTVDIYGGTVSGGMAQYGGNIYSKGTLNLYGGTVADGTTTGKDGGNIWTNGTLRISGGQISNGTAVAGGNILIGGGTVEITGGTLTGGSSDAQGGNMRIDKGTLAISGGVFEDGGATADGQVTTTRGGNLAILGGTVTITGGSFTGGRATQDGGNIRSAIALTLDGKDLKIENGKAPSGGNVSAETTLILKNGTVSNGEATENGGNIYAKSQLTIENATVTDGTAANGGNIYTTESMVIYLTSGTISGGSAVNGGNIYAGGTMNANGGTISGGTASKNGGNIYSIRSVIAHGSRIENGSAVNGGNIYAVNYSTKKTATDETTGNVTTSYTMGGVTVYVSGSTVTAGIATEKGGNVYVEGHFEITSGTVSNGTARLGGNLFTCNSVTTTTVADSQGNVLSQNNVTTVYTTELCGGSICDGNATNGGNLYVSGTALSMTKGDLTGGVAATDGGNIYADDGAKLTVSGGTVSKGSANGGGNMMVMNATVTVSDNAVIENGWSGKRGGNIRLNTTTSVMNVTGGTIRNGGVDENGITKTTYGGNICVYYGSLNISNGVLTGGAASVDGGNVIIENTAKLTVTGGTLDGGVAVSKGGALCISSTGACTVSNAEIFSGKGNNGTAIYVSKGSALTLADSTVTGSGTGTTIWNCGTLTLSGTVQMPDKEFDLMVDARNGAAACLDVEKLTSTGLSPISVRRWEVDSTDDDPGVFAVNANQTHKAMFEARKEEYYIDHADNALSLKASVIRGLDEEGVTVGEYLSLDSLDGTASWYKLYADINCDTLTKSILLDLNGHSVTDLLLNEDVVLWGMDTTTDDYDCADGYGTLTLSEDSLGEVAANVKTTAAQTGSVKRYVSIREAAGISFHRVYMGITKISLCPSTTAPAFGYKAVFAGDQVIRANLDGENAFGYTLNLEGMDQEVTKFKGAADFENLEEISLRLVNFQVDGFAETAVNASVYMNVAGQRIESDQYSYALKDLVQTVNDNLTGFTAPQVAALQAMVNAYEVMKNWAEAVAGNILAWNAQ